MTNHCTSSNWPTTAYLYLLSKVCTTSQCSKNENHDSIGKGHKINKNAGGCCQNKAFALVLIIEKKGCVLKYSIDPKVPQKCKQLREMVEGFASPSHCRQLKMEKAENRVKIYLFLNSSLHSLIAASFEKQTLKPW